jgi:hypothetical protein
VWAVRTCCARLPWYGNNTMVARSTGSERSTHALECTGEYRDTCSVLECTVYTAGKEDGEGGGMKQSSTHTPHTYTCHSRSTQKAGRQLGSPPHNWTFIRISAVPQQGFYLHRPPQRASNVPLSASTGAGFGLGAVYEIKELTGLLVDGSTGAVKRPETGTGRLRVNVSR